VGTIVSGDMAFAERVFFLAIRSISSFFNKLNKKNDILIFVDAKKKEINKRLKKRHNNRSVEILKKFQLPVELKKKKADFIIKNNFKSNSIKKNVKMILEKILLNA